MLALIRYKYLAGRRNTLKPLVVWTIVVLFFVLGVLFSFAVSLGVSQGQHVTRAQVELGLFVVGVFLLDLNTSRGSPLNQFVTREWEYLITLPLSPASVAVTELFEWLLTNVLCFVMFILAPLVACAISGSLPFALTVPAQLALLLYCIFIVLAGAWLHLISLHKHAYVVVPIRLFSILCMMMLFVVVPLPQTVMKPDLLQPFRTSMLQFVSFVLWPSTWTVQAMNGQIVFTLLLLISIVLLAWQTLPGLLRYWEQEIAATVRRSWYPLHLFFSSGWALAKWLCLDSVQNPTLRLIPLLLSRFINVIPLWYMLHLNSQTLWLVCLGVGSQQIGWRMYGYISGAYEQVAATAVPLTAYEALRGFVTAFGLIYLPLLLLAGVMIGFTAPTIGLLPGFILGLAGIVVLAYCAWKRVPMLWGFLAMAAVEIMASFLV